MASIGNLDRLLCFTATDKSPGNLLTQKIEPFTGFRRNGYRRQIGKWQWQCLLGTIRFIHHQQQRSISTGFQCQQIFGLRFATPINNQQDQISGRAVFATAAHTLCSYNFV